MTDDELRSAERKWRYFELHGSPPEWAHLLPPRPSPPLGPKPVERATEREMLLKSDVRVVGTPKVDGVIATMMSTERAER